MVVPFYSNFTRAESCVYERSIWALSESAKSIMPTSRSLSANHVRPLCLQEFTRIFWSRWIRTSCFLHILVKTVYFTVFSYWKSWRGRLKASVEVKIKVKKWVIVVIRAYLYQQLSIIIIIIIIFDDGISFWSWYAINLKRVQSKHGYIVKGLLVQVLGARNEKVGSGG